MKKYLYIVMAIWTVFLMGCASQRILLPSQSNEMKEPDPRAVQHYVDGVVFDLQENYGAALLSYQEALLYDSTSSSIYQAIGKDYLLLGRQESGLLSLARSLELDPNNIETLELLSKVYLAQGKIARAEETLHQIIALDDSNIEPYYNLALIYLRQNKKDKAVEMYRQILNLDPIPNPQIIIGLSELYMDLGRYEEAEALSYRLIELDPQEGLGYFGVGLSREAMGDTANAVSRYIQALELTPDLIQARLRLNLIFQAQKEWDKAILLYQENIERDSTDIENWLEIAEIYRQKNDTLAAITILEDAKVRFPEDWRSFLDLGRILMDGQQFEQAYQEFEKVIKREPKSFFGWLFAGISLVHMDSLDQSKSYLQKSLDIEPRDRLGNYYIGSVYARQNLNAEAIPFLEKALLQDPGWMAALIPLAGAYESLKEYTLSDSLFRKAIALEPENDLVLNNYAYSLSERGDRLMEAEKMAKKALEINPENGAYLDTMGWIYFKQGKYRIALEFIEKSFSQRKSGVVAGHLGDIYEKLDQLNKAREYWETALELDQNQPEIRKKLNRLAGE